MTLSKEVQLRIDEWTAQPYQDDCIDEINSLVKDENYEELNERFAAELEFGTGGLRGIIRNGTNGINKYVIAKATQGLANYVKKTVTGETSAAIAYDSRRFSREFAMETARVFASNGIVAYIFEEMRPTPQLSFAIRHLGCTTGVVITASHNPREYNGYKAYWSDGAQIIAPQDGEIIEEVRDIGSMNEVNARDFEVLVEEGMIKWLGKEIDEAYLQEVLALSLRPEEISKSDIKIVFSPLHGTGGTMVPKLFEKLGFKNALYVEEQLKPDGEFPTVKKPNPEEREALTMAIDLAKREEAHIVIATDPDADRMGIAVRNSRGEFDVISGNHIGSIIEYYILNSLKDRGELPENGAVVKTIVTTDLQDRIAEDFSMKVFNVLTGFKYIGEKIRQFESTGKYQYVFGGEESFGYLAGTYSRDKDGVLATLMIAECCAWLMNSGRSMGDYLNEIFSKYGYYDDKNVSIEATGLQGKEIISSIIKHLRENPPKSMGAVAVKRVLDFLNGEIFDADSEGYVLPSSNVLQYALDDGSKVTVRPSGTEPKIKFYFSTFSESAEETSKRLVAMEEALIPSVKKLMEEFKKNSGL